VAEEPCWKHEGKECVVEMIVKYPAAAMQAPMWRGVQLQLILDLGTRGREWLASRPGRSSPPPPQERTPSAPWIGGGVGRTAGLDTEARGRILCLCRGSNPGIPVCSQTLMKHNVEEES
jgi:hypothetical protein